MKRVLIAGAVLAALGFGGVFGWYLATTSGSSRQAEQYAAFVKQQKLVPVTFVVTAPPGTPADQTLYLSGSAPTLGAWEAAAVPLVKGPDGKHRATIELMSGMEHAFKVTRGTWGTVERGANEQDLANRTFTVQGDKGSVECTVATWIDKGKTVPGRVTVVGNLQVIRRHPSEDLANSRDIAVWLPPGYDDDANRDTRYPVLYMHDGNNLFNEMTSFNGIEWKLDEAAEKLIGEGKIEPVIIVGIFNSEQRTAEFTPKQLATGSDARADVYARYVVEHVKPTIDAKFRTRPDADSTAMGGSSMGGLATIAIVQQFPERFGKVALLTPHLRVEGGKDILSGFGSVDFLKGRKIWLDMGDKAGDNYPGADPMGDARKLAEALKSGGMTDQQLKYSEFPGTEHNEPAWQARVEQVLLFLYGK